MKAIANVDSKSDFRWSCAAPLAIKSAFKQVEYASARISYGAYLLHYKPSEAMRNENKGSSFRIGSHPPHGEVIGKRLTVISKSIRARRFKNPTTSAS